MNILHFTTQIFLTLLIVKYLLQQYLTRRNINHIIAHRDLVPLDFAQHITLDEHQKAADYTVAKSKFGLISRVFDIIVILIWLPLGGAALIDQYIYSFQLPIIIHGLIFWGVYSLISSITSLPFSIYNIFVLEEKFGFNKMTVKTYLLDGVKQLLIGLVIGVPFLSAILWIMQFSGTKWWIWAWLFMLIFQFIILWAWPKFISGLFNKFQPLAEGEFKEAITKLCQKVGFEQSGIFVMDASKRSSHGNAYFTGFGKNRRIVFFDTLIENLNPAELEAVMAHELGHFKLKHTQKFLIINCIFSFIAFFALGILYQEYLFYFSFKFTIPSAHIAIFLFSSILPIALFPLTPIMSYLSRKYEYQADNFSALHSKKEEMIKALIKLYKKNFKSLTPDPLFSSFYNSHPDAKERIDYLKNLEY